MQHHGVVKKTDYTLYKWQYAETVSMMLLKCSDRIFLGVFAITNNS